MASARPIPSISIPSEVTIASAPTSSFLPTITMPASTQLTVAIMGRSLASITVAKTRHSGSRSAIAMSARPVDTPFGCRNHRGQLAVDSFFNGTAEGLAVLPGEFPNLVFNALGPDQNSHSWYQLGGKGGVNHEEPMLVCSR